MAWWNLHGFSCLQHCNPVLQQGLQRKDLMAIRYRIALAFSLLVIVLVTSFWVALKLQLDRTLSAQQDILGQVLARQAADSVTELVLANDQLGLNVVASQLGREAGIAGLVITDVDGRILAPTAPNASIPDTAQAGVYRAPVSLQDAVAGFVILTLDPAIISNPLLKPQTAYYSVIAAGLVLAFLLAWVVSRPFIHPLAELAGGDVEEMIDQSNPVQLSAVPEVQQVQLRFLELWNRVSELEGQISSIGLPDQSSEEQANPRAERRMTTLVAVEVVNAQTAIELLHPGTLSILLQQYQFYLRQAARLYRGVVTRTHGNASLVTFDTRRCQDDHAGNAIFFAQLFLLLMQEVAASQKAKKAQSLEFRVAVHSGDAYFSPLWKKPRTDGEQNREESVIGKPVELVQEMLQHASPGRIIASELSYDLAEGQSRLGIPQSGTLTLDEGRLTMGTYSIPPQAGTHADLLGRQCRHLLPDQNAQASN
jgi:class 3 adenylate cyclase/uncharacterized membrane protein affecting hemolysin expression